MLAAGERRACGRRWQIPLIRFGCRSVKHRCPICRKPTDSERDAEFPFCSERCRLMDLGNWAAEKYKISAPAHDESESESDESEEPAFPRIEGLSRAGLTHDDHHDRRSKN